MTMEERDARLRELVRPSRRMAEPSGDASRTYTHEQVMQAVVAALLWGEDAGQACADRVQGDHHDGRPLGQSVTVGFGAGSFVTMSSEVAVLLMQAHYEKGLRGVGIVGDRGITRYDLRAGDGR